MEVIEDVNTDIAGVIPAKTINGLFIECQTGSFDKPEAVVKDLINQGHSTTQSVNEHDYYYMVTLKNNSLKSIITEKCAEVDKCLADDAIGHL
jgi:replication factor C subunit 2/4